MTDKIAIRLAMLVLSTLAIPMAAYCQQEEPVSRGKPLSYWMERLDNRLDTNARAAIKEMGTNALPDLIRMLRQIQSAPDQNRGHPTATSIPLGGGVSMNRSLDLSRARPLYAVACIGPAGQSALPDILPLLTNQNFLIKRSAFSALQSIGPDTQLARSALPTLLQALEDSDWSMRSLALDTLAALHPGPPEVTPAFIRFLDDPNERVREEAMRWLVAQTNSIVLPRLDKQLHDQDSYVVVTAASQIGAFGPAAGGSEPRLRQLLNDPLLTVRQSASNALAAITGQSIFRSAPEKNANLTYNMPGVPLQQFLDIYGNLAGKQVATAAILQRGQTLRMRTVQPLTRSEAIQLFEEVLKEQANLLMVHGSDGSLTVVRK